MRRGLVEVDVARIVGGSLRHVSSSTPSTLGSSTVSGVSSDAVPLASSVVTCRSIAFQRVTVSIARVRVDVLRADDTVLTPPMSNRPVCSGTRNSGLTVALLLVTTSPPPSPARCRSRCRGSGSRRTARRARAASAQPRVRTRRAACRARPRESACSSRCRAARRRPTRRARRPIATTRLSSSRRPHSSTTGRREGAAGQAADDVDVELFERRARRERAVEVVDHPRELEQRAVEALVEAERPGRAVEQADAAQPRVDAEVGVLRDDDHRGELLDALDAARTAREQLLEPQVRIGRIDRELLQRLRRHRKAADAAFRRTSRRQQRDDVLDPRRVADQLAPLLGRLAVRRVDALRHRAVARDVGGRAAHRPAETESTGSSGSARASSIRPTRSSWSCSSGFAASRSPARRSCRSRSRRPRLRTPRRRRRRSAPCGAKAARRRGSRAGSCPARRRRCAPSDRAAGACRECLRRESSPRRATARPETTPARSTR